METSRTYILFIYFTISLLYVISGQELLKDSAQDLLVSRFKKLNELLEMNKQKPQFFVGVKGKKSSYDNDENVYFKPTLLKLVRLRDKKEYYVPSEVSLIEQNNRELNNIIKYLKYAQQKLQQQNLKRITNEVRFSTPTYENRAFILDTKGNNKRAETIYQYSNNRGKKSIPNKQPYDLTLRWKFIGVRGKKDTETYSSDKMPFIPEQNRRWSKRKTQMGFLGMRGKKWTDESRTAM